MLCVSAMFCAGFLLVESFTGAVADRFWRCGLRTDVGARNGRVLIFPDSFPAFVLLPAK